MRALLQDLRYGVRMLVKTPVVSAVAAVSLSLGIAAATAMFALASSFLFEPLPFGDQDSLVLMQQLRRGESIEQASAVSMPNFRDIEQAGSMFAGMAAFTTDNVNVTGAEQPERIQLVTGTPNLFDVLRIPTWIGRAFRPEEGAEGAGNVVVLTYPYWERRFLSDPDVLGRTITFNGQVYTIIGVTPESFEMLPANVQGFRPSDFTSADDRASRSFLAFGRLRPGAAMQPAIAELSGAFARLEAEFPDANRNFTLLAQPAREWFPGPTDTKLVLLLVAVALFGVAIAGANVANLLLGRAEIRIKEIAVRTAMGAGRWRVMRQLLTESVLLALVAAALGTFLSVQVIRGLRTAMPPELPQSFWPMLDVPTLAATVVLAMVAGIVFGLAPALHATGGNLREALGEGSRGGTAGRRRKRIRSLFVMGEVAVALALLTGAAFLIKAMDALVNTDQGFDSEGMLTFELTLPEYRYAEPADMARFESEALRVLEEIPGVEAVAAMASLPRSRGNPGTRFQIDGAPPLEPTDRPTTGWQAVNPEYAETLRIPLLAGRFVTDSDHGDTRPVAVVNREFADRYFPDQEAIGQRIEVLGEMREIVGILGNVVQNRIPLDGNRDAVVYLPLAQQPLRNPSFAMRIAGNAGDLAADVRRAISAVDPDQPVAQIRMLDDHIRESLAGPRAIGIFVLALGSLAMVLAAIGIYGVMSHNVTQARREIGIRMAIGARQGQVVRMVTGRGMVLTGIGLAAGVPLAFLIYRAVLSTLNLFEVTLSPDYALFAAGMLAFVALVASYLPARKAARIQPVRALQNE